jgi:hypothetical protein
MGGGRSSFHLPTKREKKKEKSGKERREGRGGREGLSAGGRNVSPPDSFSGGTRAPSRTVFFAWTAALGKIFTVDNLRKRKIIIVDRDATCAREMGNQWTTFFFTVMWLPLCGIMLFLGLVCLGSCLKELST